MSWQIVVEHVKHGLLSDKVKEKKFAWSTDIIVKAKASLAHAWRIWFVLCVCVCVRICAAGRHVCARVCVLSRSITGTVSPVHVCVCSCVRACVRACVSE